MKAIHEVLRWQALPGWRWTLTMFGLLGLLFAIAESVPANDRPAAKEPPAEALIDQVRTAVLKGDNSNRAGAAVRKMLARRDKHALAALQNHSDPTVGVFAAWELFQRSGSQLEELYRFVGYVEGRTQVRVEKSFEAAVIKFCASVDVNERLRIQPRYEGFFEQLPSGRFTYFGLSQSPTKKVSWTPSQLADERHRRWQPVPIADSLEWSEDRQTKSVTVAGDRGCVTIPTRLLDTLCEPRPLLHQIIFNFSGRFVYVLAVRSSGSPCPLACIDAKTSELIWQQKVWAQGAGTGLLSSASCHSMQLVRNGSRLAVFGVGESPTIEVFEAVTGEALMRFSAHAWNTPSDELVDVIERADP